MKSGRTRTFIHPFYVNFSTNHITSLLGCRQLERNFPARTKKLSKIGVSDANIVCTDDSIAKIYNDVYYHLRFVSVSKNYRSVIRACMEELQQVAGENFDHMPNVKGFNL